MTDSSSQHPVRIAMWSGPRNISTAMMRAFDARPDTVVCDEPFYAHYLARTRLDHPGADEVVAAHETDPARVIAALTGPVPEGRACFYQKHMAHHLLPGDDESWLGDVVNCFLVRDPREMILSLDQVIPNPTVEQTGLPQQVRLFKKVCAEYGQSPAVLCARDVLDDPARLLELLCTHAGIPWTEAMLSWEPGRRPTDGVWAPYWYASVERSTGFGSWAPRDDEVPANLASLLDECRDLYAVLHERRLF